MIPSSPIISQPLSRSNRTHRWRRILQVWLVFLCLPLPSIGSEDPERPPSDQLINFADELFKTGEFYRAITEYMRFRSYFPTDSRAPLVPLRIGLSYLEGGRPDEAFLAVVPALKDDEEHIRRQAAYLQARAYYAAGEYELALEALETQEAELATLSRLHRLACILRLRRPQAALEILRDGQGGVVGPIRDQLVEALSTSSPPKRRSPGLAGVLSGFVPGAGQLYAGRRRDAVVSFLLNGLFVFGTVEAFRSDNIGLGVFLATVETGWWTGNVFSAVNAAHRQNDLAWEHYLGTVAGLPSLEQQMRRDERELFLQIKFGF